MKGNTKECPNDHTIALISHASKVMPQILQARVQLMWTKNFWIYKLDLKKGRRTRDQVANICWIIKKARELQKSIYFCFIEYAKSFDCVYQSKLWKFWMRWEYQTTLPASWETCMQVKKQQNWTGNNSTFRIQHGIWSYCFMAKDGETMETVTNSIFLVTAAMKLKGTCLLEEKLWQT